MPGPVDKNFPLAYLITFRCYGTWLHGDERGSMDRTRNKYGAPKIPPDESFQKSDRQQAKHAAITLNRKQRIVVAAAVREVCDQRNYRLRALNVRTNHVHAVVSATEKPESMLQAFKAYSTRALRTARLLAKEVKPWARHGSTIYLWKEADVARAVAYVVFEQGDEMFTRTDD